MSMGLILAGTSLVSGMMQASAAKSAAKAQAAAANRAAELQYQATQDTLDLQREQFDRTIGITEPRRRIENNALAGLAYELGVGDRPQAREYSIERVGVPGAALAAPVAAVSPPVERYTRERGDYYPDPMGQFVAGPYGTYQPYSAYAESQQQPAAPQPMYEFQVGGQTFDTRQGAQDWVNGQAGNYNYRGFQETPGYQFRVDEATDAINRNAAARGLRMSVPTQMAVGERVGDLANQEYDNYLARLSGLSTGTATVQQINAGSGYASNAGNALLSGATNQGNAMMAAGNARASGYANQGNAWNSALGDLSGILTLNQMGAFGKDAIWSL